MNTKICTECGKNKPLSDYQKPQVSRHILKDGTEKTYKINRTKCKQCINLRQKRTELKRFGGEEGMKAYQWEKSKNSKLKHSYGISIDDAESLLSSQDHKCCICSKSIYLKYNTDRNEQACIDHCHTTNKIRGVLCPQCNSGIGYLQEDISILEKAIKYLQ